MKASIAAQSFVNLIRLSYKEEGLIYLCTDNAKFMNHSKIHDNVFHGPSKRKMHAIRNTDIGEELLCNYLSYSDPDDFHVRNIINEHEGGIGLVSIDELETNLKYQIREVKFQNYKKTQ